MKHKLFFNVFLLIYYTGYSQNYKVIDTADYVERTAFIKEFKSENEAFVKSIKEKYSGKTGKELAKTYTEFGDSFVKEIKEKNYTFKSGFDNYLKNISVELKKQNPNIPDNLKFLIARNNFPNAYCLPNGVFVINSGLFNWLDNKDQLISVISHEFSHKILEHNLKIQLKHISEDKKKKKPLLPYKKKNIISHSKLSIFLKKQAYASSIVKRKQEIESDSLGFVIYSKTKAKKIEFVNALKNLQKFDTISPHEVEISTYKKLYSLPEQPFNENWLKTEDFSNYNYSHYKEKFDKDSISSHPELEDRIAYLKKNFKELSNDENAEEADEDYKKFKTIAKIEIIPNFYFSEQYGVGIYSAMQFLENQKISKDDELYYKEWLGKCFTKIYEARKLYQLNRYLDRVEPKTQSKSYQRFLNFMWNLKLEEIKKIADYYTKKSS